ncbi:MAG: S8 family serine peptidase [Saprospiraceae bacterium]|nr:S8 family serine peptidase [Saprospiraceae bacterium]
MGRINVILFLLVLYISAICQIDNSNLSHRFLIEVEPSFDVKSWAKSHSDKIATTRPIFKKLNYLIVEFKNDKSANSKFRKSFLQKNKEILIAHQDFRVKNRATPNDPMYIDQWDKSLIQIEDVWDISTGGTTMDGQEIVVAVIDDGYELDHEDLQANHWINKGEIEDNGIDDDGNGYVDDYNGLHLPTQSDEHVVINHGISVAGIIGAEGNNNIGISGINWDIKMMLMSLLRSPGSGGGSVLDVVEGLGYALDQRELFNTSNGAQGAFVVATNYSGGVDETFPVDFPFWCEIYDELGQVGILNIQAVSNADNDVEITGDMPSVCGSDYLLTVTNTDIADKKIQQAAYGNISVDISAPGEEALSTISQNRFRAFNGTSSSAPQVAGVVALLYSLPCTNLMDLAHNNPAAAALEIKRAILDGVDPLLDLEGITVSGGRLNVKKAYWQLDKVAPLIENCPTDITLREDEPTYTWDELVIVDDCGNIAIQSNVENGQEFRIGTTEVVVTVSDLLGNTAECKFNVTREGNTDREVEFIEIGSALYNAQRNSLRVEFETGSFETHIIDLYNMIGQRMRQELYLPSSSSINTIMFEQIHLATGPYFVVVSKAGGGISRSFPFLVADSNP